MRAMKSQFKDIAPIYDALMSSVPYKRWVNYVWRAAAREGHTIRRALDVGCGTGAAALRLARAGASVVGVDASAEMIAVAREKTPGDNPRYVVARMEELDLGETFDTAVSLFDSVNYVLDPDDLQEAFVRIHRHLDPGGLWMFDMNTPFALEMELFTQDNLGTGDEPQYRWRSHYDPIQRLTTVEMTFFVRNGDTRTVLTESHRQRAYGLDEVRRMLRHANFEIVSVWDAYSDRSVGPRTDRAFFTCRAR